LTRQSGAERPEEQKIILQNGRKAIVTVEYIGEECIIFDVKDPLLREKLSFKIGIIKII
jgi:FKBP-type peptidyl-prolyl cis-trans isomerase 2